MALITSRFGSFTLPDGDYTVGQMDAYEIALDDITGGQSVRGVNRQRKTIYTAAMKAGMLTDFQPGSLTDPTPSDSLPAAFVAWAAEAVIEKIVRERVVPKG